MPSYKTRSQCRDIISTEKTDISKQISTSGKITSPLFCSPSPLTSIVSYYYFSVFRALLFFHLFHSISGSEGISSTLGLCYTSSSPTSVTRWKIFVWSFLPPRAECPSVLGLHTDTAQFWRSVQWNSLLLNTTFFAAQKTEMNWFHVKDWEWSYVICTVFFLGRIVFMSSIIAYFTLGNGIYSMTKAAIEKFCDALRLEMKKFGVQVSDITRTWKSG